MDSTQLLNTECARLGVALKAGRVPKALRSEVRALLRRAFAAANPEDEAPADSTVFVPLLDAVERLLRATTPAPLEELLPSLGRLLAHDAVRIRAARRQPKVQAIADRYLRVGKRLDARVEWFWKRCEQNQVDAKRPLTAREKAAAEFADEDLEYVWGKKPR